MALKQALKDRMVSSILAGEYSPRLLIEFSDDSFEEYNLIPLFESPQKISIFKVQQFWIDTLDEIKNGTRIVKTIALAGMMTKVSMDNSRPPSLPEDKIGDNLLYLCVKSESKFEGFGLKVLSINSQLYICEADPRRNFDISGNVAMNLFDINAFWYACKNCGR
jgi:hypothetical protein